MQQNYIFDFREKFLKMLNQNKKEDEIGQNLLEEQQKIARQMGIDSNDSSSITEIGQDELIYIKKKFKMKFIKEKYIKGGVLGVGSYGKVKEFVCSKSLERLAAKIIKLQRLKRIPKGQQNVMRELKIMRRMNHCNVVKFHESFWIEEKQKLYFIMEYCVGVLQEILDSAPNNKLPKWQAHRSVIKFQLFYYLFYFIF